LTESLFRLLFMRKTMMASWDPLLDLAKQSDLPRKCGSQRPKKLSEKERK